MASVGTIKKDIRTKADALAPVAARASRALLKHIRKESSKKNQLIETHESVQLQFGLRKIPSARNVGKPLRVVIPNSLLPASADPKICLFVKEEAVKALQEKLEDRPVEGLTKVIGLEKLRKAYSQYADKRELLASFDLFLADDRILPMLSKALGKAFFSAKKQPIPIKGTKLTSSKLEKIVAAARDSTFVYLGRGDCVAVRVGKTSFTDEDLAANCVAAIAGTVSHIDGNWGNIQCINLKSTSSVALPLYNDLDLTATAKKEDGASTKAVAAAAASAAGAKRKASEEKAQEQQEEADEEEAAALGARAAKEQKKTKTKTNKKKKQAAATPSKAGGSAKKQKR
eukprot:g2856.t1